MSVLNMQPLRELQACDVRRLTLENQLSAVPREIAAVEARIAAERQAIEAAKAEWHALESKKKLLEMDILAAQQKAAKYRTQQLEVRKNDEYRALTHEIETTEASVSDLEGQELEVMYAIDEAKKRFAAAELELKSNIAGHEARITTLRGQEADLKKEQAAAMATVETARGSVAAPHLRVYDRLATKPGHPVCVPVESGRCGGCHMKVSSHIDFEVRKSENLVTCDQCGRIVYLAS